MSLHKGLIGKDVGGGSVGNKRDTFDRMPWVHTPVVEQTLSDYIRRKNRQEAFDAVEKEKKECCGNPLRGCPECPPRKLTFEEWMASKFEGVFGYDKTRPDDFILWGMPGRLVRVVWKAAQENK